MSVQKDDGLFYVRGHSKKDLRPKKLDAFAKASGYQLFDTPLAQLDGTSMFVHPPYDDRLAVFESGDNGLVIATTGIYLFILLQARRVLQVRQQYARLSLLDKNAQLCTECSFFSYEYLASNEVGTRSGSVSDFVSVGPSHSLSTLSTSRSFLLRLLTTLKNGVFRLVRQSVSLPVSLPDDDFSVPHLL